MTAALTRRDAALALAGAALAALPPGRASAAQTLRVGIQKYGSLVLLRASGLLEKRLEPLGWRVEWRQFVSGPPLMEALGAGAIDVGTAGDTPPIFAQAAGVPLVYLGTEPPAPRGEAILVHEDSPIRTLADLKGKKVAFNKGSNVHALYIASLAKAGINPKDVTPVYLSPPDGRAAFERRSVDAWVIWDPFLAAAQAAVKTRVLVDGTGLAGNRQFYLGNKRFTDATIIQALRAAITDMDKQATADPKGAAAALAPGIGLPEPVVAVAVARQTWNLQPVDQAVAAEQQRLADTFFKLGLIPRAIKIADALPGA
ncbi:alkanesulfonate transporter subunit; periplasmic-binding component of ABC superfamily protein [Beijerinckiaceae bacterium RH AL1]|nr:sulfonate ABC transporter substrate-binding protein [Beijerinckiaceae bacterium]VVB46667.1 alkanesulfonate transporter subunit; periplasmic-binding component of ABC superfamily protein [Beijerinckiaceae bacterium RH CH11]VVB46751.1 alkanesulfonate transporter subunit; periplasmic-binding component of ABC superfamily protein [Beijerinckiaceae bacterium RH AL8]VVC55490.1 alkanesulfonate transporter subunit; periplasmic-binding component of ABC superfamily protein [Beijerinckiaceae bacterium RH 